MKKGPGLYTDIGKKARDLLYKDYQSDHKFTVTTYTSSGVDGPGISDIGDLIIDLNDGLVKQRPNCMSGSELIKSRENHLQSHIQHR